MWEMSGECLGGNCLRNLLGGMFISHTGLQVSTCNAMTTSTLVDREIYKHKHTHTQAAFDQLYY